MNEKRYHVVKAKLTDTEYKKFIELLKRSGARNQSEFLRERIFLSNHQIIKRERMAAKIGQELLEGQLCILSDMHSIINQFKAGVDTELAVDELEEEVKKLCRLLK